MKQLRMILVPDGREDSKVEIDLDPIKSGSHLLP